MTRAAPFLLMNSRISSAVPELAVGVGVPSLDQKIATKRSLSAMIPSLRMCWGCLPSSGTDADSHIRGWRIASLLELFHRLNTRSEEHTSELQSPYVISYAVFCLK